MRPSHYGWNDPFRQNDAAIRQLRNALDMASSSPQLELLKSNLNVWLPKYDLFPLATIKDSLAIANYGLLTEVRANLDRLMPKIDFGQFPSLQSVLSSAKVWNLPELEGFRELSDRMAEIIDFDGVGQLATSVLQVIPASADEMLGSEILDWASSVELDDPLRASIETDEASEQCDEAEKLREHLQGVAAWLVSVAATLRAATTKFNSTVDMTNEQIERYQKLTINLLALYAAVLLVYRHI
jgi:hypothetical protein